VLLESKFNNKYEKLLQRVDFSVISQDVTVCYCCLLLMGLT